MLVKYVIVLVTGAVLITNSEAQKPAEQRIQSYATCRTDRDCKDNSFCFGNDDTKDGKCKCLEGFELYRNSTFYQCLPGSKLGEPCEEAFQCEIRAGNLAFCNKYKLCDCNEEAHNYTGICYLKVKIGEICMSDGNCYLENGTPNGGVGYCVDGRCSCKIDQKPSVDNTTCLNSRKLAEPCVDDEECSLTTPNTQCLDVCKCSAEYALTRDETACVKAATHFGDPCDFDSQCSKFLLESICNAGKCGCNVNFHDYGLRCVPTKKSGERCDEDAQCIYEKNLYENVWCQNQTSTCQCIYGTGENGICRIEKINDDSAGFRIEAMNLLVSAITFISLWLN